MHHNKTALVLSSSKGLGKACALELAKNDAKVIITSHSPENLKAAREEIERITQKQVIAVACDVTNAEHTHKLVNDIITNHGSIDILVNNTPGPRLGGFFDINEEDLNQANNLLVLPIMRILKQVLPHMQKNKFGRVITLTSRTVKEPSPYLILSNMYRVALVSMLKTISKEVAKDNVYLNSIGTGAFNTERLMSIFQSQVSAERDFETIKAQAAAANPTGRIQDPCELAAYVNFLATEQCSLNGTHVNVDGGESSSLF